MSIKLLGVDLDGTLFYPKRKIRILTKENKKFLQDFIDQGNQVLLISGRNYYIAQVIENVIKRRVDMISCNGASIHYYDKLIDENPIPKDIVKKIFKGAKDDKDIVAITFMCNRHPMVIVPTSLNKLIRPLLRLGLFFQFKYQEPYVMGKKHLYKILEDDSIHIYKIMLVTGMTKKKIITARNLLEHYQDKFGDEVEIAWSNQSLEIMKKGVNKANALKKFIEMVNLQTQDCAVIGDSGNDILLFREFENCFVMSHAPEEVKKEAKQEVKGVYELRNYIMKEKL